MALVLIMAHDLLKMKGLEKIINKGALSIRSHLNAFKNIKIQIPLEN